MFGSLGIFQAMVQALKTIIEDLLGTTSDTYADDTLMGRTKTGIKSIQRGVIVMEIGTNTATATISAVITAKSTVNFLGFAIDYNRATEAAYLKLTNTTTVTAVRLASSGSISISYDVIEFY